jgi:predicted ABC-type ATPase
MEVHGPSLLPPGVELIGPQKFLGSPEGTASRPQTPLVNGWDHDQERREKLQKGESFAYETHYMDRGKNQRILEDCHSRGYRIHVYYFGVKSLTEAYAAADNVRNLRGYPLRYHQNIERGYRGGIRELQKDIPVLDRVVFCDSSGGGLRVLAILDKADNLRLQSVNQEKWFLQHFEGVVNSHYPHPHLRDYQDLKPVLDSGMKLSI